MLKIKDRISDALLLWDNNKKESAFLLALTCVAAISRKRYPNDKDGDAFRKTFQSFSTIKISVEFRGNLETIENVFYKWIRCELVHDGGLPFDVEFVENNKMSIRAGGYPEYVLKLGTGWFYHLINSVLDSSEIKNNNL